jgi:uncharacterized membrane protein YoaK (UPF0700 family)
MADEDRLTQESRQTLEATLGALVEKVNNLEQALAQNQVSRSQSRSQRRDESIIWACFGLGAICIGSIVVRLFIAQPNWLDPIILILGLVLCGLSLFSKFTLKFKDISLEGILRDVRNDIQRLYTLLR